MNHPRDLIRLMRPVQWLKNAFVFIGLIFGRDLNPVLTMRVVVTAIAFCMASSAMYIINDILDRESDRHHPKKKNRPLAAGLVSIPAALCLSLILGVSCLAISMWVSYKVLLIIFSYCFLNIVYSIWLKHVVIIDVFCISAGFMLRILAGTVGVGIPPSKWLLLCSMMLTLFLGFAKRRAEIIALSNNKEEHRKVLVNYGPILLDEIIGICATGVIITYSLYTMSPETILIHKTQNLIYTVPFVVYGLFRYIYLLHHCNQGGDPSKEIFKDPHILGSLLAWAVLTFYLT